MLPIGVDCVNTGPSTGVSSSLNCAIILMLCCACTAAYSRNSWLLMAGCCSRGCVVGMCSFASRMGSACRAALPISLKYLATFRLVTRRVPFSLLPCIYTQQAEAHTHHETVLCYNPAYSGLPLQV
jgi:hypothetical protein